MISRFLAKNGIFTTKTAKKTDFRPKKAKKGLIYVLFCKKKVIFIKD